MKTTKLFLFCFLPLFSFSQVEVRLLNFSNNEFDLFYIGRDNYLRVSPMTADMQFVAESEGATVRKVNDSTIALTVYHEGGCHFVVKQSGRMIGAWQFRIKYLNGFLSKKIRSLKTDTECEDFIKHYVEGYEGFYFDTIFSESQVKELKQSYRNWGITDLNNDQKPDLWFVGRIKDAYWHHAQLLLSDHEGYQCIKLFRNNGGQYSPLLYTATLQNKNLLFVHLFDERDALRTDSLMLLRKHLYPKGIRYADTLIYQCNSIINFARSPSHVKFDSIYFLANWNQTCQNDGFMIYSDGRVKYTPVWCGNISYDIEVKMSNDKLALLKELVSQIDFANTNVNYSAGWTDMSSATTTIYSGDTVYHIWDYGMESSFTLKALYRFLHSLPRNKMEQ